MTSFDWKNIDDEKPDSNKYKYIFVWMDDHFHVSHFREDLEDWVIGDQWQSDGWCHSCQSDLLLMDNVLCWAPMPTSKPILV